MTIFLLSLGGFPPLGGFIAKWYVFSAAVKAGYDWLAIIGVLTSVVVGLLLPAHRRHDVHDAGRPAGAASAGAADRRRRAGGVGILVLYLGILPTRVLDWAAASISTIF